MMPTSWEGAMLYRGSQSTSLAVSKYSSISCLRRDSRYRPHIHASYWSLFQSVLQFALQFLNSRQAAVESFREGYGQLIFGNAYRLGVIPQSVLGDHSILGLAEDQSYAWLIVGMSQEIVDSRQVEIHLFRKFRLERGHFEVDHNVASEL